MFKRPNEQPMRLTRGDEGEGDIQEEVSGSGLATTGMASSS